MFSKAYIFEKFIKRFPTLILKNITVAGREITKNEGISDWKLAYSILKCKPSLNCRINAFKVYRIALLMNYLVKTSMVY